MSTNQLDQDYAYCETVIKKASKSFYAAFSKLPEEKAKAVYAIYAFCRRADDTVDTQSPIAVKKAELEKLENELERFCQGETLESPMWRALRDVFNRFDMDAEPFFHQLEGQKQDLDFQPFQTLAELEDYSYYVAGSVGLMLLPILATKQEKTSTLKESALSLGVAMQLTNILRDVREDFRDNQRIYMPVEILDRYDVSIEEEMKNGPSLAFNNAWEEVAAVSEKGYEQFWQYIQLYDADCRFAVLVAAKLYAGILDSVRKNHYNCLQTRSFVSPTRMVQLIAESKKLLKS